jgi:hypothetical protein
MWLYDYTHLQLGHKHEHKDQTQTVKPVFMSDTTASVTELIAAGHCVAVPHVAGVGCPPRLHAVYTTTLCGIQYDKESQDH